MEPSKVSSICMLLNEKIDPFTMSSVKSSIENLDDSKYDAIMLAVSELKNPTTILLFSLLLGQLGVDRFILGKVGSGICKLLFGWLTLGIWWLVDVIKSKDNARKYNSVKLTQAINLL